jgi:hypothetical protein
MAETSSFSEIRGVAAVVVRGRIPALERFLEETRSRSDIVVIYVRTGAGKLRIVEE